MSAGQLNLTRTIAPSSKVVVEPEPNLDKPPEEDSEAEDLEKI